MIRIFLPLFFLTLFLFHCPIAFAEEITGQDRFVSFDTKTIEKGFTIASNDTFAKLIVSKNVLRDASRIDLKQIDASSMQETFPSTRSIVGNVYLFDVVNKKSYDGKKDLLIDVQSDGVDHAFPLRGRRSVYFYNGVHKTWESLPSIDDSAISTVHARIRLPFARIAVFEEKIPSFGRASWYAYKGCDCAASPDYPKGTKLRVTNIDNPKKTVIVRVNDFGPERDILPDRIIDLDRVAFKKLANTSLGVIRVRVEPIQ